MAVKKQGRNKKKPQAMAYKAENRAAKNKVLKAKRHAKKHPNDVNNKGPFDYTRVKPEEYKYGSNNKKQK